MRFSEVFSPSAAAWPSILLGQQSKQGFTVSRKQPEIGVQMIGPSDCPRFLIANNRQRYWTGHGWSHRRSDSLLYAHLEIVRQDFEKLVARSRRRK
jgi:hypothetical protein